MKVIQISDAPSCQCVSPRKPKLLWSLSGFLVLALSPAAGWAGNLLVNPSFDTGINGHVSYTSTVQPATGWTYFSPPEPSTYFGDYWVESALPAHSGKFYWKEWGALNVPGVNNVAGIYQDLSAAPGSAYQASGWFYTSSRDVLGSGNFTWLQVEFLGANTNLLAVYKSDNFDASVGTDTWFQYLVTNACNVASPVSV